MVRYRMRINHLIQWSGQYIPRTNFKLQYNQFYSIHGYYEIQYVRKKKINLQNKYMNIGFNMVEEKSAKKRKFIIV